jgi:tetratricopeptide (TPR) repeat protein
MKNIPGELVQSEWINFSHNRNQALLAAKAKADYVLLIDADDVFNVTDPNVFKNLKAKNYLININSYGMQYKRICLVHNKSDALYKGALHEVIVSSYPSELLNGIEMKIIGGGARHHDTLKFQKDAELLQKEVDLDPTNTRSTFYLAQSYRDAEENKKAIYYYKQRILLGGWEEEVYISQFQIGVCAERLGQKDEAMLNYLRAYNYRPSRAEAIYNLSVLCRNLSMNQLGYIFAKKGVEIPFPNDILFVEKNVHDYLMVFELSIHAYWVGKYQEAVDNCTKLAKIPNVPQSILDQNEKNIQFSFDKLKK